MKKNAMRFMRGAVVAGAVFVSGQSALQAQVVQAPVRVAIVSQLPTKGAKAEVLRYAGGEPAVILLARGDATSQNLLAGLSALSRSVSRRPVLRGAMSRIPVFGVQSERAPDPVRQRRLEYILAEVRSHPEVRIGNLGQGRWATVDRF